MNVLGLSGFHRAVTFKKREMPDLRPQEYRMVQGMDSAAAIVNDEGIVAACAEERFCGEKGTGRFPLAAVDASLRIAGLRISEIDRFAHGFDYESCAAEFTQSEFLQRQFGEVYSRRALLAVMEEHFGEGPWDDKLITVPHHLAHACSAFYPSKFGDALIMVCDGMGEQDSATLALGHGDAIDILARVSHRNSLGMLYGLFTLHLGFRFNSGEYKVMGLAPYGRPDRYYQRIRDLVQLEESGLYSIPILQMNVTELERQTYRGSCRIIEELVGPPRAPEAEVTQNHKDVAAALQVVLQQTLLHTLTHFKTQTGAKNLCLAGGVALNCSANGAILRSRLFSDLFVQPAAGDDGAALGAALWAHRLISGRRGASSSLGAPFLGEEASDADISEAIELKHTKGPKRDLHVRRFECMAELYEVVAELLASGSIVGWFQGRMEFGPRALGNRSILADPRDPGMRSRINALVKKREEFRPFAPAVLAHRAAKYFGLRDRDTHIFANMLFVTDVRPQYRALLPAVTHVDASARVQTVHREHNLQFFELLEAFERKTGLPILLNTSFNVRGQPIVRTAADAVDTFLEANLDVLVMGNRLITTRAAQ